MTLSNQPDIFVFTAEDIRQYHDMALAATGGKEGLISHNLLDGLLWRVESRIYYDEVQDPIEVAAWYGFAIADGHAFEDGNKRTGVMAMGTYLKLNKIDIQTNPLPDNLAEIMIKIADGKASHQDLVDWLRGNVSEE